MLHEEPLLRRTDAPFRPAGGARAEPRSRRGHRADWTPAPVAAVKDWREDYPMRGKAGIALRLQRRGYRVGESTTGRILKSLMERGAVTPAPLLRRNGPRAARRVRPCAGRLPKGRKPTSPGEIVQRDTLAIPTHPGRPAIWLDACAEECNTFRPHHAPGGQTPAEHLANRTAKETRPSHMS